MKIKPVIMVHDWNTYKPVRPATQEEIGATLKAFPGDRPRFEAGKLFIPLFRNHDIAELQAAIA